MIGDTIEIEDENGNKKTYSVLFKFDELDNNEHYVVYTDYSINENEDVNIMARQYSIEDGRIRLSEIKSNEIKDFIRNKLENLKIGDGLKN